MKVTYSYKGTAIGEIVHTNIENVVTPYFNKQEKPSRIFQRFNGHRNDNWMVLDLKIINSDIAISIIPESPAKSLGCIIDNNRRGQGRRGANSVVTKYALVDVEFSHKQNSVSASGQLTENTWKIQGHLPGELHKRRPCIVLSIEDDNLEVIPLSTVPDDDSLLRFKLSDSAFSGLHPSYSDSVSYAVTRLKQTVSLYRVFPLKEKDGKYKLQCHGNRINKGDKNKLHNALTTQYGLDEIEALTKERDQAKKDLLDLQNNAKQQRIVISELRKDLGMPLEDDLSVLESLLGRDID